MKHQALFSYIKVKKNIVSSAAILFGPLRGKKILSELSLNNPLISDSDRPL